MNVRGVGLTSEISVVIVLFATAAVQINVQTIITDKHNWVGIE